jgi:hypothetical protein
MDRLAQADIVHADLDGLKIRTAARTALATVALQLQRRRMVRLAPLQALVRQACAEGGIVAEAKGRHQDAQIATRMAIAPFALPAIIRVHTLVTRRNRTDPHAPLQALVRQACVEVGIVAEAKERPQDARIATRMVIAPFAVPVITRVHTLAIVRQLYEQPPPPPPPPSLLPVVVMPVTAMVVVIQQPLPQTHQVLLLQRQQRMKR